MLIGPWVRAQGLFHYRYLALFPILVDYFIMSQTERVFDILYQLSSEEGFVTLKEIAERYEISTRQAARDIEYVRTRILPSPNDIVYDWQKRAYRLSEEADTLSYWKENMLISLSIYNNAASDAAAHLNLEEALPDSMRRILRHIDYRTPVRSRIDDEKWLSQIFTAFDKHSEIIIRYRKSPDSESEDRDVDPLRLVNYQNAWYLIGYDLNRKGLRTFRLSRVEKIIIADRKADEHDEKNLDDILDSSYGIFLSDSSEIFTMRFRGGAAVRVSSEIWHEKQRARWIDGEYELSVPAASSVELLSKLLSFGADAYPVSPESFVKEYRETVEMMDSGR